MNNLKSFSCKNCGANLEMQKRVGLFVKCSYCGLEHLIEGVSDSVILRNRGVDISKLLFRKMRSTFGLTDIKNLVVFFNITLGDLGIDKEYHLDYDNLSGSTKDDKIIELLTWVERRGKGDILIASILEYRPDVELDV